LSAAKIKYGHEQAETLSVTVKARTGGTPGGQVTVVAGEARICVIKLKAARGTCQLGAKKLKPGTYQLTGKYGGSGIYGRSTATAQNLTVVK
jgi:Bacterial Ig-like domain (group 3)